jgi:hypothetical protein
MNDITKLEVWYMNNNSGKISSKVLPAYLGHMISVVFQTPLHEPQKKV